MKEKILVRLKAKYSGVNLSKARLDAIADKLATKITDETEIDAKLDELNELIPFADIAKQDDQLRTLQAKAKKDPKPSDDDDVDEPDPEETKKGKKKKDDVPEWAKSLLQEVQSLKAEKAQTSIRQKATEKLKDVPEIVWAKRALPEKEEDLDDFVTEVTTEWTAFKQDQKNEGLLNAHKPGGAGTGETPTGKEDADIEKWAANAAPKKEKV